MDIKKFLGIKPSAPQGDALQKRRFAAKKILAVLERPEMNIDGWTDKEVNTFLQNVRKTMPVKGMTDDAARIKIKFILEHTKDDQQALAEMIKIMRICKGYDLNIDQLENEIKQLWESEFKN